MSETLVKITHAGGPNKVNISSSTGQVRTLDTNESCEINVGAHTVLAPGEPATDPQLLQQQAGSQDGRE